MHFVISSTNLSSRIICDSTKYYRIVPKKVLLLQQCNVRWEDIYVQFLLCTKTKTSKVPASCAYF